MQPLPPLMTETHSSSPPTQCVVLAGGLGTRMHPRTQTVPKALLPVGGVPFVDHQLRWLAAHGVREVVFSVGYLGDMIEDHVGNGDSFGLPVRYVHEGKELRGTAGALRLALDLGVLDEHFLLTYGDSYLPVNFAEVAQAFAASRLPALMTVFRNEGRWDTSNVAFDSACKRVILYDKSRTLRPVHEFEYIDYGLSALRRETIEQEVPSGVVYDLAQVFHRLSLRGELAGFEVFQRFYEIGSPAGLAELEAQLAGV